MNALIYVNLEKDVLNVAINKLVDVLKLNSITYKIVADDIEIDCDVRFDVLFVIGGDGTILRRTAFSNKNDIPIIGINCGKLGYLSEFEVEEIEESVKLLMEGKLIKDERTTMLATFNGEDYLALNDVNVQRIYVDNKGNVINVSFYIDDTKVDTVVGDGIIVATPTGSTAYSLSAGGPILVPGINSFSVTPVSAHSVMQKSVVYSAESTCVLKLVGNNSAGLFIDGKFISLLQDGDSIGIKKAVKPTIFLRREKLNFYKKLSQKLFSRTLNNYD